MTGLSKARLARLDQVMAGHVESGYLAGAVALVSRGSDEHVHVSGAKKLGGDEPMRRDTIFRIASLTKLVTAVATMMLVEQCQLRLDDPVDNWLPELAGRRVLRAPDGPVEDTVPAARPITVRDLLTFQCGYGQAFGMDPSTPIQRAIADLEIAGFGPPKEQKQYAPDEWLSRLGTLPLMHQPGEGWLYNLGSYILSALVPRVVSQPFDVFLRERVFEPLGMPDTSFFVPDDKLDRLAYAYLGEEDGGLRPHDGIEDSLFRAPPVFPDGGGGLVSTVDDLHQLGRLLLGFGRVGDRRLLARPTVELMVTDHQSAAMKPRIDFFPGYFDSHGWGLGLAVTTARRDLAGTPGRFGWDGGHGTSLWVDPAEDLIGILLTQRAGFPPAMASYNDFWTGAYQAIDD
ncbi:serine hydrolase domain-containing protein [Fodinicola acaciae]|uniref:serine hydrolase domain-containing protein n=1 Tax=Fodinicola acaciae TaxID=2681555 RepID=UPI001C9E4B55|nr:serine hydrolase domain-containing protein [Fodinicola acaciae]